MQPVYICDGVRTPIGRYGGALSTVRTDDLAAIPLRELLQRHTRLGDLVDEVYLGCANQAGEDNRNVARMALLLAGLSEHVPGITVNRLCASGMDAVGAAARAIACGEISLGLAGGVESMSRAPFVVPKSVEAYARHAEIHDTTIGWRFVNPRMEQIYGSDSMPQTAQNVADDHGVSRADQDNYSFRSQQRTAAAQERLRRDIVAVDIVLPRGDSTSVIQDEHPRPDTTAEALARLKPVIPGGSVTAGNSSGVNDGAAAVVLANKAMADRAQLRPLARIMGVASAGTAPRTMGIGPVPAVRALCDRLDLNPRSFGIIELNEAFASQVLACARAWGLPDNAEHLNPNGGAISLGHPLGMSGVRLILAAARELHRCGERFALVTMCVGVGQGVAMALERVEQ